MVRVGAIFLIIATVTFSSGIVRAAKPASPVVVEASPLQTPASKSARSQPAVPANSTERDDYAKREQRASADLAKFEGGNVVIVTSTTVAILVLVIVILLIL